MVENITDTYDFEVKVIQHGNLEITNVSYPSEIEPSASYTVSYDVTNNGGSDLGWGRIMDVDTSSEVAGTRWQGDIPSGTTLHKTATLTGKASDFHGRIEVGYLTE